LENLLIEKRKLSTLALVSKSVYGEKLKNLKGADYREWSPSASKLATAIKKGLSLDISEGSAVLYLGASTGTTASHISDLVGRKGIVFAVEKAFRPSQQLVFLAEERKNIAPIFADAGKIDDYSKRITTVSWLYQDISQRNQVQIFLDACNAFLEKGCQAVIAVKARSIDFKKPTKEVFAEAKKQISSALNVEQEFTLEPFQKDHCIFACRKVN